MDENFTMEVSLPEDEEGMVGRECPEEGCGKYFKVTPGTGITDAEAMFCPYCEYEGGSSDFLTQEQKAYIESLVLRAFEQKLTKELKSLERHSFRGQFLSLEIKLRPTTPSPIRHYLERSLQENILCENCGLSYAIYGAFAVCPDCGQQNVFQVIRANLELIERQVDLEQTLRERFAAEYPEALEEMLDGVGQQMVEDAYKNTVTVFETFFKELYSRHQSAAADPEKRFRGNLFQRLEGTRDWFIEQFDCDIYSPLEASEVDNLDLLFNKRHILTHNLGIIDEKYLQKVGLSDDVLDHKVEVSVGEVATGINSLRKVVDYLQNHFATRS